MDHKHSYYYKRLGIKSYSDQKRSITYSFNEDEKTIRGAIEERDNLIFLYEYRGKYIGNEFFISFSKESISYKLIKIEEIAGEAEAQLP